MILPKHVTILVDTREQKPLPLPKTVRWSEVGKPSKLIEIRSEPMKLYAGDYMIKGAGKLCVVERKGNINELHQNLQSRDRPRAIQAFRRLMESTENPILALDFPLTQHLYKGDRDSLFTKLAQLCVEFNLQILSVGGGLNARHTISDLIVRVLLAHYFNKKGTPCSTYQTKDNAQLTHPPDLHPSRTSR